MVRPCPFPSRRPIFRDVTVALISPKIVGPLSVLSTSIRVLGQISGVTVSVYSAKPNKHLVAEGVATGSDQRFPLLPGAVLTAQDQLFAVQESGAESSAEPAGDLLVGVQPAPTAVAEIGHVDFKTHLYECGRYIWLTGAVPGATVEVLIGGQVQVSGLSLEVGARLVLPAGLQKGVQVTARQVVPNVGSGPATKQAPKPLPLAAGAPLPPPVMHPPVRGCDVSLHVTDAFDGALVTLKRGSGATESVGFDTSGGYWCVQTPFVAGEVLTIRQEVAKDCQRQGLWSEPLEVGPAAPVEPPLVLSPLCVGATVVTVVNLRPGALVRILANGQAFTGQAPPDETTFDFTVAPLTGGSVSATQEVCGVESPPSPGVKVHPHDEEVAPAAVVGPLFSCAKSVSVDHVHPGATLQVRAKNANYDKPISDLVTLYSAQATISVTPHLKADDEVYVVQWACSDKGVKSAAETVKAHPPLVAPALAAPIFDGDPSVRVDGVIPGALVELHVDKGFGFEVVGSLVANNLGPVEIHQDVVLAPGDVVVAEQFLCGTSVKSASVRVTPAFGRRPFYILGHNTNTIAEVKTALAQGANALEPDVNVFSDDEGKLCISHGEGDSSAPVLVDFLKDLHTIAVQNPQLALVVFDCKSTAATPDFGLELLDAIRANLTFDLPLNVIISVASFDDVSMFDKIHGLVDGREGLMIDEENDAVAVRDHFAAHGVVNRCYGNGNHFFNPVTSPNLRPSVEHACALRAGEDAFKFVYIWPINSDDYMKEVIRIGLDGIITDNVGSLKAIIGNAEFSGVVRLATRADNLFKQPNAAYGLSIHTADVGDAGTDAHLTFTLTGTNGTRSKTIDSELNGRMEQGDWNHVTIPSPDLGDLLSITVERDDVGNGPDWFLDRIIVRSARYKVAKEAVFDVWIDSPAKFTKPLV
ncbi:PLAT/LH2 domain-containing protein [Actinosynnema sp. NPDC050436]|uniref:PLAT/LH2 domain-containing protein n=1 Tax=Actinosynnema sp. NPDC050436 TaxID=3155659 RepID=UPI0033DA8271